MNEVVLATATEDAFHDQLHLILKSILKAASLQQGWIYLYNQENEQFHLATWHGVPDDQKEPLLQCSSTVCCSCQEKLLEQSTTYKAVLSPCDRWIKTAEKNRIYHLSLPLQDHQNQLGIVNLEIPEGYQRREELKEMISWIQPQLSEFTSKAWLEVKLREEEQSRNKLMKALIQAQEDERSRLAQELHDGAGQMLTGLLLQMKALQGHTEDPDTAKKLNHLANNISGVIEYIRRLSYQNHPAVLYELGLEGAIINLVEDSITPAGMECSLEIELNTIRLPKEIEFTLYRIIQECFTNLIRHADADHCFLRIWNDAGVLQMEIIDDGRGMNPDQINLQNHQGVGLSSIKERLSILGGELTITSQPEDGTCIYVKLPLLEEIYEN
jgi:signal transduction histidine kinase